MLAPIALFVFRRPDHTRRTIETLLANPEAAESDVVVFADGPRDERDVDGVERTRDVVRRSGIPRLRMVERDRNLGLARSVVTGVTELCEARGSVIVLEDDLVLAPTCLRFMNDALERYRDEPRVFGVSAYMFPITPPPGRDAFFLPFIGSWGWATWQRAWRTLAAAEESHRILGRSRALRRRFNLDGSYPYWAMLDGTVSGKVDSWAVRWYATVFRQQGLMLYPARSLVENVGFDGTGVHCGAGAPRSVTAKASDVLPTALPSTIAVDGEAFRRVKRLFRREHGGLRGAWQRARFQLGRIARRVIPVRRGER